ncbi:MAG: MFS transporter [Actinomycetota bacterium]|nr:MFS transporter [Actinomycetota bacterium]
MLVRGAFASVFAAATGAALPEVVADKDLDQANTMLGVSRELGSIVGPVLAGLLFAVGGARPALLFDAATFLVTIPRLATLPRRGATLREETLLTSARLGLRTVFSTPIVRGSALGFWLAVLASAGDDRATS